MVLMWVCWADGGLGGMFIYQVLQVRMCCGEAASGKQQQQCLLA